MNEPVTEMRQYFEGIISKFISLSQQAHELEQMKHTLSEVQNRLNELSATNVSLRNEITQTWEAVRAVERERDTERAKVEERDIRIKNITETAQQEKESGEARISSLLHDLASRDTTIYEQAQQITQANVTANETNSKVQTLESYVIHWRSRSEELERDLQGTNDALKQAHDTVAALQNQLRETEAKLAKVRSVFEPVAAQIASVA